MYFSVLSPYTSMTATFERQDTPPGHPLQARVESIADSSIEDVMIQVSPSYTPIW